MEHFSVFRQLGTDDAIALALTFIAWFAIGWRIEHPGKSRTSVTMLMGEQHKEWLKVFVERDPRIFDSQLVGILRQGTAFFASTTLLAMGGLFALIGNVEFIRGIAEQVTTANDATVVWQLKLALVTYFTLNAFLKFVWAHRVFGYGTVIMGAVPNDPLDPLAHPKAAQAAELNFRAVINFNRGLRALYFALGGMAWLLGAIPLMVATTIVVWVLWSREFASLPRTILLRTME